MMPAKDPSATREKVLSTLGASPSEKEELLTYNMNRFNHDKLGLPLKIPLPDEPFIETWENYLSMSREKGVFSVLKEILVQLSFPVLNGISGEEFYISATRRGVSPDNIHQATGIILSQPETIRLLLHQTPAGRVPLIITGNRQDFEALVQALTKKNEPAPVSESMGAVIVAGCNNWDRIRRYRNQWEKENPSDCSQQKWEEEFKRFVTRKELYQDKFIILSEGPYSGVSAEDMGMSAKEWKRHSLTIRVEHEAAHYFTRQVLSSMQNSLIDEFIADYMGITAAAGHYRADWFLRFIGLSNFPEFTRGGRLEIYRGDPPLSDGAFRILQAIAKQASENLEQFDSSCSIDHNDMKENTAVLIAMTFLTMEEIASLKGVELLKQSFDSARALII